MELLAHLRELDVRLWLEGDRLRFNAPKEALTPALRAELVRRKADLVAFLSAASAARTPVFERISRQQELPLSYSQERLWFLVEFEPGTPAYNLSEAVRLEGRLDDDALAASLAEIVRRHEVLRTTFTTADGRPHQVISPPAERPLPVVDLGHLPVSRRRAESRRLASEVARISFDLTRGPLLLTFLLRFGEADHIFLLVIHHIVFDGWSMRVFLDEMTALYGAFSAGRSSPLPEPALQYADFAAWQKRWLQGKVLESFLAYWRRQLDGASEVLRLSTDRPRAPVKTENSAKHPIALPASLAEPLRELSRRHGVTLFMILLAALKALLHRYTGQRQLSVGTYIANRDRAEIEKLIGFFLNTLVLRTDLSGNPGFAELLRRVRDVTLGAYAHQDLPFEKLLEELQPKREMSHSPLFQVMLVLQNIRPSAIAAPGLTITRLEIEGSVWSHFDWTLWLWEEGQDVVGYVDYNTDLFDSTTIRRMLSHFRTVLEGVVAEADGPLSDLPLLSPPERHQLQVAWNDTRGTDRLQACIHHLFEAQVERSPDAVVLVAGEERLTYGELDQRANQMAHYLQAAGVCRSAGSPEALVGLAMDRCPEMVIALLGILKAGGAYLPLDPEYPRKRLAFMIDDARIPVLVTRSHLLADEPPAAAAVRRPQVFVWEEIADDLARQSKKSPATAVTAGSLAYVIYTSGSSGRPKGVQITHASLAAFASATGEAYALTASDRILQFASLSFDTSGEEIYPCLIRGATLFLRTDSMLESPRSFVDTCCAWQLTVVDLPTAYWHELTAGLTAQDWARAAALRLLIIGGEKALPEAFEAWWRCVGRGVPLFNNYGPTETTVAATAGELSDPAHDLPQMPIGRPMRDVRAYVLDPLLRPVPSGVAGQLSLGGPGLARGYLNRPARTAESFLPDRFGAEPGERLYQTGDRVRYLGDGRIQFLGRIDHQVKVRGFRIEPGEIETILGQHPAVRRNVVVAREDVVGQGGARLVAYVECGPETAPTVSELYRFLQEKLPEHMLPSAFMMLDALPLLPSGKVDRRRLPPPDRRRPELEGELKAPATPIEEALAEIFSELTGLEQVGVNDNFFELGGHSLLATQAVSRIREAFELDLALRTFFESPRVAELALEIEEELHARAKRPAAARPLRRRPAGSPAELSFAQQRLWFLAQLEPGSATYNIPSAVRFEGRLISAVLERSLNEIVRRHETLRTTFTAVEGRPFQVIASALEVPLPVVDLGTLPATRRLGMARRLTAEEARRPFDLERGPVLRARLLRLGEEDHVLLLTLHHICSDIWSMGVLIREMATLYKLFAVGEPASATAAPGPRTGLAELPIQYADFAYWQRRHLAGETLEKQLAYWRRQLAGAPSVLELPTDRCRPPLLSYRGATHSFVFPDALANGLVELGQRQDGTLFMTLTAAFALLLHRYTGQRDLVLGAPIANRNRSEIEGLIGFFVNTLLLRIDLSDPARGELTFRQALARVREMALDAYAHQDLPFEKLLEELQPERHRSQNPLFQVAFAFENSPVEVLDLADLGLAGLTPRPFEAHTGTAKFDLTLLLWREQRGLAGFFEYATDLFDGTTIARLARHFERLLESIVARPAKRISTLELMTPAERQQVVREWTATATEYPRQTPIHELFAAWAGRTPDAVAVVLERAGWGEQRLTYRELDRRANQLARHLCRRGVGPDVLVAVVMERSLEMMVGILGILKAGGAYLPLDPAYPYKRLALLLAEARAPVVLTQSSLAGSLPLNVPRLCLDADWGAVAGEPDTSPGVAVAAESLSYVMHTSGTTGRPKGVGVPHRAVVRLVRETNYAELTDREVFLHLASVSFDASTLELWGPLANGGCLVLHPGRTTSLEELGESLARHRVTTLWLTAGLFHQMVETQPQSLTPLRQLLAGGDVLSVPHVRKILGQLHGRLINGYGPTENTTFTCCCPLPDAAQIGSSVPIGRPIANTRIYLLDGNLEAVPVGVTGMLYTGGDGLARSYFERPGHTSELFIPDPFSAEPGGRLYRIGDLGRYLPDGNVEFLGRVDLQVKVRGFRIELGEIEAALASHPAVGEVAVIAREDSLSDKRLVAYIVPSRQGEAEPQAGELKVSELRRFLKEILPDYMVPAAFVELATLPLNPNGKVNRRALPAPDAARPDLAAAFVAPRNAVEEALAGIWGEALRLDSLGVEDDFFELGGHSLLATQLISRIRKAFRVELPVASLFDATTVAAMAHLLVENEPRPGQMEKIAWVLLKVRSMSDADVAAALARKRREAVSDG